MCLQKVIPTRVCRAFMRRLAVESRGQELVEFAMVLPVLMMLLIGVFWMGRVISIYQAMQRAAREGAEVALAPTCATCAADYEDTGPAITAIDNVLTAATIDPTLMPTPPSVNFDQPFDNSGSDPANYKVSGVTVTVQYPVQLNIPFIPANSWNYTPFTLSTTVTMKQEF